MKLNILAKKYFKLFSAKKIKALEKMFASNIILRDWNIHVKGKKKVVEANKKIFRDCKTIKVTPTKLHIIDNTVLAEIEILIDKKKILVLDILKFNREKKISSIKAFLGS
jgi:hypothetical protein